MKKLTVSSEVIILIVAMYIAAVTNITFWDGLVTRLDLFSIQAVGYLFTSFSIIVLVLSIIFFVFGHKILLKPILIFFIILSSTFAYFNQELGVIFDKEMVRNIVENITDRNINEARELLSYSLFLYVFFLGIIPSIIIALINISHRKFFSVLMIRSILTLCLILTSTATFAMNYKFYTYFYRQNEDLLVYVTPIYPIVAVKKYIKREIQKGYTFHEIGDDAHKIINNRKKTIGIMVIGETARADHFALNGYQRQTNPMLSQFNNIINFKRMHSCGTSTAYSVPCMFSFFDHENYSPEKAKQYSNVLDVLNKSGVNVVWQENNSSCKGVCARIREINLLGNPDKNSKYYNNGQYYDEAMISSFDEVIDNTDSDVLLVLHSMGSHGPKYHNRFPDSFAKFKPYCKQASPQECSNEELINSYDNTIIYTDHFLSSIINYLKQHDNSYDTFMMYVSDHGESLGENGVYLHGLPYFIAPEAQTHVPFIMWFSDSFDVDNNFKPDALTQLTGNEYTHDNLSHTLLGLFGVQTRLYKHDLDIFHKG